MPVLGIDGLFFRSKDPDALSAWYREHPGIGAGCVATAGTTPDEYSRQTEGGPVVFAPFKADTDYFAADRQFMSNVRVSDIDGLIASLTAAGVAIITNDERNAPSIGKFVRSHDPEGNAVELWEPPAA